MEIRIQIDGNGKVTTSKGAANAAKSGSTTRPSRAGTGAGKKTQPTPQRAGKKTQTQPKTKRGAAK